jgi:hypothetical protein
MRKRRRFTVELNKAQTLAFIFDASEDTLLAAVEMRRKELPALRHGRCLAAVTNAGEMFACFDVPARWLCVWLNECRDADAVPTIASAELDRWWQDGVHRLWASQLESLLDGAPVDKSGGKW